MSWNVNMIGKKDDVKAAFNAELYVPQPLKDTVALFCDAQRDEAGAVHVVTSGHFDANYGGGNVYEFRVMPVYLVEAPKPPAAPPVAVPPEAKPEAG